MFVMPLMKSGIRSLDSTPTLYSIVAMPLIPFPYPLSLPGASDALLWFLLPRIDAFFGFFPLVKQVCIRMPCRHVPRLRSLLHLCISKWHGLFPFGFLFVVFGFPLTIRSDTNLK